VQSILLLRVKAKKKIILERHIATEWWYWSKNCTQSLNSILHGRPRGQVMKTFYSSPWMCTWKSSPWPWPWGSSPC